MEFRWEKRYLKWSIKDYLCKVFYIIHYRSSSRSKTPHPAEAEAETWGMIKSQFSGLCVTPHQWPLQHRGEQDSHTHQETTVQQAVLSQSQGPSTYFHYNIYFMCAMSMNCAYNHTSKSTTKLWGEHYYFLYFTNDNKKAMRMRNCFIQVIRTMSSVEPGSHVTRRAGLEREWDESVCAHTPKISSWDWQE